jgi:hypothetical protein
MSIRINVILLVVISNICAGKAYVVFVDWLMRLDSNVRRSLRSSSLTLVEV